jgi:hypothetical protein
LELVGRGIVAQDPIHFGAAAVEEEDGGSGLDLELLEQLVAELLLAVGPQEDEILVQEILELGVAVVLLTQQYAAPSATAVEVDQDQLVLALGLGHGLVQGALEPGLGGRQRSEDKHHDKEGEMFFHGCLAGIIFHARRGTQYPFPDFLGPAHWIDPKKRRRALCPGKGTRKGKGGHRKVSPFGDTR